MHITNCEIDQCCPFLTDTPVQYPRCCFHHLHQARLFCNMQQVHLLVTLPLIGSPSHKRCTCDTNLEDHWRLRAQDSVVMCPGLVHQHLWGTAPFLHTLGSTVESLIWKCNSIKSEAPGNPKSATPHFLRDVELLQPMLLHFCFVMVAAALLKREDPPEARLEVRCACTVQGRWKDLEL